MSKQEKLCHIVGRCTEAQCRQLIRHHSEHCNNCNSIALNELFSMFLFCSFFNDAQGSFNSSHEISVPRVRWNPDLETFTGYVMKFFVLHNALINPNLLSERIFYWEILENVARMQWACYTHEQATEQNTAKYFSNFILEFFNMLKFPIKYKSTTYCTMPRLFKII